ncbi:MAG: GNAT family N-acetyltransferase [Candidatus Odinarchaeia archaeon]
MNVLLDTNIYIERENYQEIPEDLRHLLRILNEIEAQIYIHPLSIKEIKSDKNPERRNIVLSKLKTYKQIEKPPSFQNDIPFLESIGSPKRKNDFIDYSLLYCVYRDAVNFLITQDKRLLSKANKIGLENQVLSTNEALDIFQKISKEPSITWPPAINENYCYSLSLEDPFFDSFKQDYPEFAFWFKIISQEHRKCWAYRYNDGSLGALLIYKEEEEAIGYDPVLPKRKRFKICSLKAEYRGSKIGELFIKLSCDYALKRDIDEIYLTVYSKKQPELISLIEQYGFLNVSRTERNEDLYLKKLVPDEPVSDLSPIEISRIYYPTFYDGEKAKKYVVPIRPEYHSRLFTRYSRQTLIPEHLGEFIIEGNTIKKAYLCHSSIKKIRPGDILLFYQSHTSRTITALGVVEDVHTRMRDPDKILQYVSKRTVYSYDELKEISKKPTLVILFKLHFYFDNPVEYQFLINNYILKGPPQTITEITDSNYMLIKKEGVLNEHYTVN